MGRDENGKIYGRNKIIKGDVYQKTPLSKVCDIKPIKNAVLNQAGIPESHVETMVVYGELMCNRDLYRYNDENLFGTW